MKTLFNQHDDFGPEGFCNQLSGLLLGRPDLIKTFDSENDSKNVFDSNASGKFLGGTGLAGRRPAGGGRIYNLFGAKSL